MFHSFRCGLGAAVFVVAIVALGCGQDDSKNKMTGGGGPPAGGPGGGPGGPPAAKLTPSGPHAAGMTVFNDHNCGNCHSVEAGGRGKAPNLSKVGKDRDATWLAAHIKDPKSHEPMSKMPKFEGKINDADLKALAEFLASLK